MEKKRNIIYFGIIIASTLCSLYVLYRTFRDVIISSNQVKAYPYIFGFILFLVYLLCNLFTKLVATSASRQNTKAWKLVTFASLLVLSAFFLYSRLRLVNTVDAYDSAIYRTAFVMVSENFSKNKDLVLSGINNPTQYVYSLIIAFLFRVFGVSSRVFIWADSIICILCVTIIYNIIKLIADRFSALFVVFIAFFMPSTTFVVYSYTENPFFALVFLSNFYLFFRLFTYKQQKDIENDEIENVVTKDSDVANKLEEAEDNPLSGIVKEIPVVEENDNKTRINDSGLSNSEEDKTSSNVLKTNLPVDLGKNKAGLITYLSDNDNYNIFIYTVLYSISTGFMLFCEPTTIIPVVLLLLLTVVLKKDIYFNIFIAFAVGIFLFTGFTFAKSIHMDEDFGKVIAGQAECFDFLDEISSGYTLSFSDVIKRLNYELAEIHEDIDNNSNILNNRDGMPAYSKNSIPIIKTGNELLYVFLLVMFLTFVRLAYIEKKDEVLPFCVLMVSYIILSFLQQNRVVSKLYFVYILLIICGLSIHYMYLSHHPEERPIVSALDALTAAVEEPDEVLEGSYEYQLLARMNNPMYDTEFIKRAEALIFVDVDEELYSYIKDEEKKKAASEGKIRLGKHDFDDYDEDFFLDADESDKAPAVTSEIEASAIKVADIKKNLDEISKTFEEQYSTTSNEDTSGNTINGTDNFDFTLVQTPSVYTEENVSNNSSNDVIVEKAVSKVEEPVVAEVQDTNDTYVSSNLVENSTISTSDVISSDNVNDISNEAVYEGSPNVSNYGSLYGYNGYNGNSANSTNGTVSVESAPGEFIACAYPNTVVSPWELKPVEAKTDEDELAENDIIESYFFLNSANNDLENSDEKTESNDSAYASDKKESGPIDTANEKTSTNKKKKTFLDGIFNKKQTQSTNKNKTIDIKSSNGKRVKNLAPNNSTQEVSNDLAVELNESVETNNNSGSYGFAIENSTTGWEWDYDFDVKADDDF